MEMLVFRPDAGRTTVTTACARRELLDTIDRGDVVDALVRAGEIEVALADAGLPSAAAAAELTDLLGGGFVAGAKSQHRDACDRVARLDLPEQITLIAAEGFSYYALNPADYATLARRVHTSGRPAAVIGIRSIGTTLSAIVAATLKCERITVRPIGHPYNRETVLGEAELRWVRSEAARGAMFYVVDEGPGLSGSSFLSVAEALEAAGVPRAGITLLCSRMPDPEKLLAHDAARRWRRYRAFAITPTLSPPEGAVPLADWRARFLGDNPSEWPGQWTEMSAPKFVTGDGCALFKHEGIGRHGCTIRERSRQIAEGSFGPESRYVGNGFMAYTIVSGRPPHPSDLRTEDIRRMAEYLAWRTQAFPTDEVAVAQQEDMARFNYRQITGRNLDGDFRLEVAMPVIADARMMPYEWLRTANGTLVKTDGASHGDNHFFPGPVDIAWDLAGAIVEWGLSAESADLLLRHYRQLTGDDAVSRLPAYKTAYCCFQAGFALMAANAVNDTLERVRLERDAARYAEQLETARLAAAS